MGKWLEWTVPQKFLRKYDLKIGAKAYSIIMIVIMVLTILAAIVDMTGFTSCGETAYSMLRSAYAFSTVTIIYSLLILLFNLWFLWRLQHDKESTVLVWVVVTSLWLTQTTMLTIVLLFLFMSNVGLIVWLICLVFSAVAFIILLYGVMVVYGLWLKIKKPEHSVVTAAAHAASVIQPILPKSPSTPRRGRSPSSSRPPVP